MRISEFPAGVPTTDESELLLVVQGGLTQKLTLAQANALRQPFSATLVAIAGLTGTGYLYRDSGGTWSFDPGTGGSYDPAGTAAALIAAHDVDAAAHNAIVAAFLAHRGVGGLAEHPVANATDEGFMPRLPTDLGAGDLYLDGLGNFTRPNIRTPVVRIDDGDSPYAAAAASQIILADASAGAITVDLAEITAEMDGCQVIVKALDATNTITIDRGGSSDLIDGATSTTLTITYQSVTLVASYDAGGSFWSIV